MKNIAIITARSGSKGLPDKNIRPLNGVPLLAYSIKAAFDSGIFDTVMVSTDSEEYAEIARAYGAEVPFLRSAAASGDRSNTWTVIEEVLDDYEKLGRKFDAFALLQPTSPLRLGRHLREAYALMQEKNANAVVSLCESELPLGGYMYLPENFSLDGLIDDPKGETEYKPRQIFRQLYRMNGALYLCNVEAFRRQNSIYDSGSYAYIMDQIFSVDVDTLADFQHAEALVQYLPEFKDYFG